MEEQYEGTAETSSAGEEAAVAEAEVTGISGVAQMIKIPQPSMALNAVNVPGPRYKMWNTWEVEKDATPERIIGWIANVARGAPGGRLQAVVVNCHGAPSILAIGTGIHRRHTGLFTQLSGLVGEIYIVACQVALIEQPTNAGSTQDGDGNLFCCEIAKNAQATVFVSTQTQTTGLWPVLPFGVIDGFEGLVLRYSPDGSCERAPL